MADYDNRLVRGQTAAEAGSYDAGLRRFMQQVYNYMFLALVVTGLTAYGVYTLAVTTDPAQAAGQVQGGVLLTNFGVLLYTSPLKWVLAFSPLIASLVINRSMRTLSFGGAQIAFWIFAGVVGISLSTIFVVYATMSIAEVFFITAAAFGGLSLYGYTTKRDLSGIASFLIMGVWGIIIALIVNMFLQSAMMMWVLSIIGVGVFAGLTATYTQSIKEMYFVGDDGSVAGKKAIWGALALYISFINLFQFLLSLMGGRR